MTCENELTINDELYVKKSSIQEGNEVIVRTYSAGVHVGVFNGEWDDINKPIVLENAKRIYRWSGANTLNEIATNGLDRGNSKISNPVATIKLIPIEIITVLEGVDLSPIWE